MARSRPYVILNAAMTLDGKIATASGDSKISSAEDLRRVHRLRARVDAILVGINTVIVDDPMLTVKGGGRSRKNPVRVIVDSRARIPLDSRIMRTCRQVQTVIASSQLASRSKLEKIRSRGAILLVAGRKQVDLAKLLYLLKMKGVKKLLVEGGGEINWSMLSKNLVDEVIVTVAPRIVGGRKAITLAEGLGSTRIENGVRLKLRKTVRNGNAAVLYYRIAAA